MSYMSYLLREWVNYPFRNFANQHVLSHSGHHSSAGLTPLAIFIPAARADSPSAVLSLAIELQAC